MSHSAKKTELNVNKKFTGIIFKLTFDICDSANVIFSCKHKFIVNNPIGFVIQACRWVQLYNLVILNC